MKRLRKLMSERGEARAALASVISIVLVIGLLQAASTFFAGGRAFGQAQPSPSSGFTIQFLNPSGVSREMSSKNDGTDSQYHIVAWVNKVPTDATVEFKYQSNASGSNEISVGPGTLVGSDTYEFKWDMSQLGASDEATGADASSGKLRAILYSGSSEVARDEEAVRINEEAAPSCPSQANPPPCNEESQAQTVELTYPSNAGSLGYYRPIGDAGPPNSVFGVTSSTGTLNITSWYTLSAPGTEPQWKACRKGSGAATETKADSADGVRCEYAAGDSPSAVQAVAVRAHDQTEPILGVTAADSADSSDAHRAFPYDQDVTTVELANGSQGAEAGDCSLVITATLKDQVGRTVADANVDVHAAGPSEDLAFDDSDGAYSAANKPPENHATETAKNCESDPPNAGGSNQGEHEELGPNDRKHVESSTDTTDAGQWKFALWAGSNGETQYTAWADEDGNDRLCSAEAQGDGAIGWGTGAPTPTGLPDEDTSCPRPGPTGSATASPTATASRTTARPSGTSTSPAPEGRTITLVASRPRVTVGQTVTLAGQIFAPDAECEDDEFVRLTRRVHGQADTTELTTTRTDDQGRFSVDIRPRKNAEYQATSPAHDNCGEAVSSPVDVQVRVRIALAVNDKTPERGDKVRFVVRLKPKHRGEKVLLQAKPNRRFKTVARAKLNRRGRAVFVVEANWRKRAFRARYRPQSDTNEGNTSRSKAIRSHR